MPRAPRLKSKSGIYHIMFRGINQQTIFKDDEESLIKYNNEGNKDGCLEIDNLVFRLSDEDARKEIKKVSGYESATEFQILATEERDKYIKRLKNNGLSIRQISRLTGVSKGVVEKI